MSVVGFTKSCDVLTLNLLCAHAPDKILSGLTDCSMNPSLAGFIKGRASLKLQTLPSIAKILMVLSAVCQSIQMKEKSHL